MVTSVLRKGSGEAQGAAPRTRCPLMDRVWLAGQRLEERPSQQGLGSARTAGLGHSLCAGVDRPLCGWSPPY